MSTTFLPPRPHGLCTAAVALTSLLALTACGSDAGSDTGSGATGAGGGEADQVTLAVPFGDGSPAAIPLWLGEELGYFEEEGIEVEVVSLAGRPAETVGLVTAGQADLVQAAPDTIIVPAANGNDQGLDWIFTPYQRPVFAIAVMEGSDITSAKDLEGKTVAMSALGPPFETFTRANVSADGGDGASVSPVAVSGAAAIESLANGEVDAVVANRSELALSSLSTGIEVRVLELPEEVAQTFAASFLMREDSSDEEKDAYARFLRSYMKSAIFARENPAAAVEANWERFPASKVSGISDEQNMEQATTVLLATVNEFQRAAENDQWGYISPERWEAHIDYLGLTGRIEDPATLYDYSLLEKVNEFDEGAVKEQAASWTE